MRGERSVFGIEEKFGREGEEVSEFFFLTCLSLDGEVFGVMKEKIFR